MTARCRGMAACFFLQALFGMLACIEADSQSSSQEGEGESDRSSTASRRCAGPNGERWGSVTIDMEPTTSGVVERIQRLRDQETDELWDQVLQDYGRRYFPTVVCAPHGRQTFRINPVQSDDPEVLPKWRSMHYTLLVKTGGDLAFFGSFTADVSGGSTDYRGCWRDERDRLVTLTMEWMPETEQGQWLIEPLHLMIDGRELWSIGDSGGTSVGMMAEDGRVLTVHRHEGGDSAILRWQHQGRCEE